MSQPLLTESGLAGVPTVPYGVHMCQFYEGAQDLVAVLVPYFLAGLRGNERCLWITAEPLNAARARAELQNAGLDVEAATRSGALVIRDYDQWYTEADTLKGRQVAQLWLAEEQQALADGYRGLRITGNTSFLTAHTWSVFMEYEEAVTQAFQNRRIVTLCTYQLADCGPAEILDVRHRHHCALEHSGHAWRIVSAPP